MSASEISGGMTLAAVAPDARAFDALITARIEEVTTPPEQPETQSSLDGKLWFNRRVAAHLINRALCGDTERLVNGIDTIERHNPLMALNVRYLALRHLENNSTGQDLPAVAEHAQLPSDYSARTYEILVAGVAGQLAADLRRNDGDRQLAPHDYMQFFDADEKGSPFSLQTQRTIANTILGTRLLPRSIKVGLLGYLSDLRDREHEFDTVQLANTGVEEGHEADSALISMDIASQPIDKSSTEEALYELRAWLSPEEVDTIREGAFSDEFSAVMMKRIKVMSAAGASTQLFYLRDVLSAKNLLDRESADQADCFHDDAVKTEVRILMVQEKFAEAVALITAHPARTTEAREYLFQQLDRAINASDGVVPSLASKKVELEIARGEVDRAFNDVTTGVEFSDPIAGFINSLAETADPEIAKAILENFDDKSPEVINAYNQAIALKISTSVKEKDFPAAQVWFGIRVRTEDEPEFDALHDVIIDQHVAVKTVELIAAVGNPKLDINVIINKFVS